MRGLGLLFKAAAWAIVWAALGVVLLFGASAIFHTWAPVLEKVSKIKEWRLR